MEKIKIIDVYISNDKCLDCSTKKVVTLYDEKQSIEWGLEDEVEDCINCNYEYYKEIRDYCSTTGAIVELPYIKLEVRKNFKRNKYK